MITQINCFQCGKPLEVVDGMIGRRDTCSHCGAELHCCRMCDFYDPKVYNECREPSAERVIEKDRSNFCDYFTLRVKSIEVIKNQESEVKKKLEALFKKKE